MSDKNIEPKGSFWTTVPGCITAIGGLVSVVVAAVVALSTAGFIKPPIPATATPHPTTQPSVVEAAVIPQVSIPPTLAPVIPTDMPLPPSPIGKWIINANNYEGVMEITSIVNGKISGTLFDEPMLNGSWSELTLKITFKRSIASASDPNAHQIYYGDLVKQGDKYVFAGTFEQFTASGKTGPFNWSAQR